MSDCIFCKIVNGEIPCHKIYENEGAIVFLDISPVRHGHVLVVPKVHSQDMTSCAQNDLAAIMSASLKVISAMRETIMAEGFNFTTNIGPSAGQAVFHTHFHIIPRNQNDGLVMWPHCDIQQDELKEIAQKIRRLVAK
jgi:histidine triad (HIT) family protein